MQHKLATWSTQDKDRRFDRLLRLIAEPDWLAEAARITLGASGSKTPGVDGITKAKMERTLHHDLEVMRAELLAGTYSPMPARRVYIPKANGKMRPLGIPTLRDRIVQRAMVMAMDPIWESDFHRLSYGFRPARSVHHAIRTVKLLLTESDEDKSAGRWVIEGDLASYFDTVHHRLLMRGIRKRIADQRFLSLLWKFIKAGHVERGVFMAASEGVPQGGVISPLLSNIMLHEFDLWVDQNYLNAKVRKDRWAWNNGIKIQRPIAILENRQWKPGVSYCRYADDFVMVVKGNKAHAEEVREACRAFLEGKLKLTLNMDKTHVTHVNDGFVFLGHRIIRKRGSKGTMRVVTTIPWAKYRGFVRKLVDELSGNYSRNRMDVMESINRKIAGWANFYKYTDFRAMIFRRIDRAVFWRFGHWLARKYRQSMSVLMQKHIRRPSPEKAKTWVLMGQNSRGWHGEQALGRLMTSTKRQFRYRGPEGNPYLAQVDESKIYSWRFDEVTLAMGNT